MPIAQLAEMPAVRAALHRIEETDAATLADQLNVVRIPAPPYGEGERGRWMLEQLGAAGLVDGAFDDQGNVLARLPGSLATADGPVLLAAHLDTVFPADTPLLVRRSADRLEAPGIADNARGLAAILAIARALVQVRIRTERPVVFVATVGEEGVGDLRGVKHLFRDGSPWREAAAFISLDGTGRRRIVHRAIGARRLRVWITGPGGHSWADWGRANPVHALGVAIADMSRLQQSGAALASLSVGRIGGGTSVNAIPESAWLELDLRSEDAEALRSLEARARASVDRALRDANAQRRRGTPPLQLEVEIIGDRPTGAIDALHPIVEIARDATRHFGDAPELVASSTDANIPIALGIPAIALGAGGEAGGTHTIEEWYRNEGGPQGIQRALLITLALAGVA